MATKKTSKLALVVGKPRPIEGRKDKLYEVALKRGSARILIGEFLATTETAAKKQARAIIRRELGK